MLYKYEYIKFKKLRELNFHFLFFMRKIKDVSKGKIFTPNLYFHEKFLNSSGRIAPKGTVNKDIHDKFKLFFDDFKSLDQKTKNEFYNIIIFSQKIHLCFEDASINQVIELQTANIKRLLNNSNSFNNLMDSLWNYLKSPNSWEIDKYYKDFYEKLPESKMCPFCGLNEISDQELFKSDLDHIAFKANYPISSINLNNIAPSCSDCNQKFKKSKDVFFKKDGTRRVFTYPYIFNGRFQNLDIEIDLRGSIIPNTNITKQEGEWLINFKPDNDFTTSWEDIYRIKKRYSIYIKHIKWLQEFTFPLKIKNSKFTTQDELRSYLSLYKEQFKNKLITEYHIKYSYFNHLEISLNEVLFNQINGMCA